jgi:hypothetical protein
MSAVACSPMTTLESDITNDEDLSCPPPKCVRIRKTAPAAMKACIKDLKQKQHFSTAHKEATRLFAQECAKPEGGGMSDVEVAEKIETKGSNPSKLTVAYLTILLTWHQHQKIAGMNKAAKVLAWKGISDNNWQPPSFSKWTKADERKLAEASATIVTIGHTALIRMVDMRKKELVLAVVTMPNKEFKVLLQERQKQLNEQITNQESSAQTVDELVAALETSVNATTEGTEGSL